MFAVARIEGINRNVRFLSRYGGWRKERSAYVLVVACRDMKQIKYEYFANFLRNTLAPS